MLQKLISKTLNISIAFLKNYRTEYVHIAFKFNKLTEIQFVYNLS